MNKIKIALFISSIFAIGAIDLLIYQQISTKHNKEYLLLELSASKMTAFLLGNHINLTYAISDEISKNVKLEKISALPKYGNLIISKNNQKIASFVRFDDGTALKSNEYRIAYQRLNRYVQLMPDKFYLPAKQSDGYRSVKYAAFKFSQNGQAILAGLADPNKKILSK